ncbi:hypothetical protein A2641_00665 [Candidatus Nomurabacteria bacterium RIFCSPHIGHO2_01_FULL_37_25]|uniref:NADH:ubiquinone oxidoreductase-like 20kDa subunit domain-containing protein n=1 Tax=Candidatus Nomurabacteria bacterium RIFCSPLOWO2_01_FULL_36_16 TaxID=1801767 RepID=A0A1F6WYH0_9BACT|nr:MAG: hypothetical protein A2641_00665 [Candidatus Nomurabacteria bacterium RIFCSPHIGHO2_01_FULL_37_25]OGI75421.1 MAG: hypothetical protein A3D36_01680 [Candidatus Nomurabacteria bacterium RIFCSPHIGHO2_02_FULL_36_29]OGI86920.1 MAG: hypothetical protein A3A91_00865 [Candidatus Nomurabacteria bacterium RIFCSPLOWO2_01_FULL_36_16]OGI95696.1 MAG: hypothetical protein A3I84_01185 [Candidatus Nomurabacteria bacterium RIFCSPLOWO2_02_FULL_36_8]
MFKLFLKIFRNKNTVIPISNNDIIQEEIYCIGEKIHNNIKCLFNGSLAIRQVDAGSDNACEQELVALSNSYYDIERFGIHFVASPRHADMLLVTGPLTRNMVNAVQDVYNATPTPKIVVTVGDDVKDGGIFKGSYAILDNIGSIIPIDFHIPGDPPTPKAILLHLLKILETLNKPSKLSNLV